MFASYFHKYTSIIKIKSMCRAVFYTAESWQNIRADGILLLLFMFDCSLDRLVMFEQKNPIEINNL